MKSMSIVPHGKSRWNWVCRCTSGVSNTLSPAIHILAGEKVCIQAITPRQSREAPAARQTASIESAEVTTALNRIGTGKPARLRPSTSSRLLASTWRRTSGP